MENKVRENRLRRMADRQGLKLRRSPRRDEKAIDYDLYALTDYETGGSVFEEGPISIFTLDLDDIEQYLTEGELVEQEPATVHLKGELVEQEPATVHLKGELVEQEPYKMTP